MTPGEKLVEILDDLIAAKVREMKKSSGVSEALRTMQLKADLAKEIDHLGGTSE